ncbi:MAG: Glu/Leu/Phe/Val dehydrogenase [Candidatus Liptonbacteria bacterium]|nr:Glu/Leu/Phe/Val dehydrogenase [Candidatus Liptonbacteria bacterium]
MTKDEFGPEYAIEVYDPKLKMEGFLVIDNTILGPGKGGLRMTPNVSLGEVFRLARTMTWKNALAGIPFGGAKAGIRWGGGSEELKKQYVQSFARLLKPLIPKKYIAGPDVQTGEREMRWFVEATGDSRSATGKPADFCLESKSGKKCGLPHELGSTGFGVAKSTEVALRLLGLNIQGATCAIHGFGNVATFTFKFLTEMGAKVVALADSKNAIFDKNGLDGEFIQKLISEKKRLSEYPQANQIETHDFWGLEVDILIPSSVTDIINQSNKDKISAKIIVEAANIPMREEIEQELHAKGILIVPDFVANAGGVISSYAEYRGMTAEEMFKLVESKIRKATETVIKKALKTKENPRKIALELAQAKVEFKMKK